MSVEATIGWDSEIAKGAAKDAASLDRLLAALDKLGGASAGASTGPLATQLGQVGNAAAAAAVQTQALKNAQSQQSAAAASAAQQNAALAKVVAIQAKGDQDRARIAAQSAAQRVAAEQKAANDIERIEASHAAKMQQMQMKEAADARKAAVSRSSAGAGGGGDGLQATDVFGSGGRLGGIAEKLGMAAGTAGAIGAAVAITVTAVTKLAEAVDAAYQKAVAVITSLGQAGIGMVFAATSAREQVVGIFEALGKTTEQSEGLYQKIVALSIATGRDKATVAAEFKRLSAAGFKDEQLPIVAKMLGDVAAVKGDGKANQLEKIFEKLNAKGSLDKRVMTALVSQGVAEKEINEALAKALHKPIADIPALIKSGKIDAATAEKAISDVIEKKVGGAAEKQANTILALIARIKMAAEEMFALDEAQVAPVKDFLKNVLAQISGPAGQALQGAIKNLFGAIFDTAFGDLNKGDMVADTFRQITAGVNEAASAVRSLRPEVQAILAMFKAMMHDGTIKALVEAARMTARAKAVGVRDDAREVAAKGKAAADPGGTVADGVVNPLKKIADLTGHGGQYEEIEKKIRKATGTDEPANDNAGPAAKAGKAARGARGALDLGDGAQAATGLPDMLNDQMKDDMSQSGNDIGQMLNAGMAQGIADTMDQAVAAGGTSAEAIIARVRAVLAVHSPSGVFEEIGGFVSQGMAGGIEGDAHHAAKAAGKMAAGTAAGAMGVPAPGGFGPSAGKVANGNGTGGAGGHTFNIKIEGGAAAKAGGEEALVRKIVDAIIRELAEAA